MEYSSVDSPEVAFDFNLPHGFDDVARGSQDCLQEQPVQPERTRSWSFDHLPKRTETTPDPSSNIEERPEGHNVLESNYRQFAPGFSDDDADSETFKQAFSTHHRKKRTAGLAKSKKSPRRSGDEDDNREPNARAKKPRRSLFGGLSAEMSDEDSSDMLSAPPTPGSGIGNRMSSLTLEKRFHGDEVPDRPPTPGVDLASSDIGSVHDSPAPSDEEVLIPPDPIPYYELRQNIDRRKAVTHVDTDKSGNWDPAEETKAKKRTARSIQRKLAKKEKMANTKKESTNKPEREYTMKCIVKLAFDNFGNVRNATSDQQNWPAGWSDIDSEQERELQQWRAVRCANNPTRELQVALEDPANEVDDLTGHPAARGCKQCRKLKQQCSMIKTAQYPCDECVEDDGECQPIQAPRVKERCKQCNLADEEACSFEHDPTQRICDRCAENNHDCEALPPPGYTAPRIIIDDIIWGPNRPHVTCTACRTLKKRCSLKSKLEHPPCKYCRKQNIGCLFDDVLKTNSVEQTTKSDIPMEQNTSDGEQPNHQFFTKEDIANMYSRNAGTMARERTPEIEMEDAEGNKGILVRINTSFAHPIRFNIQPNTALGCHFCEIPIFGMVGHFEKEVHVIRWHSGLGYAEVGGGHCSNTGETVMCENCTKQRLQILVCPEHQLERIPDATADHAALTEELLAAEPGGAEILYQLSRWCSLCFSPAAFGCSTVQASICGEEYGEIAGCNLRLCLACEVTLRTRFGKDFDAMATALDDEPKISEADEALDKPLEGRPRADVGFLKQDGLLSRQVEVAE